MATKYGEEAFRALAAMNAAFKAKRNVVFVVVAVVVAYLLLNKYVFVGTLE